MIESSRRHGPFDPRFRLPGVAPATPTLRLRLGPDRLSAIGRQGKMSDGRARAPVLTVVGVRDDARLADWENEGGRSAVETLLADVAATELPAGLGWYEFVAAQGLGRRRHDLRALKAYEAYRNGAGAPPPRALR
jgi:hypothetical protein